MFCPKCGNQMPDGSVFCGVCGNQMADDSQFCVVCGTKVEGGQQVQQSAPVQPQAVDLGGQATASGGSKKNIIIGILAAIIVVLAVVLCIFIFKGSDSSKSENDKKAAAEKSSEQKEADLNAKNAYSGVQAAVDDLISGGNEEELEECVVFNKVIKIGDMSEISGRANVYIYEGITEIAGLSDDGYIYIAYDESAKEIQYVQWLEREGSEVVGQYPESVAGDPDKDKFKSVSKSDSEKSASDTKEMLKTANGNAKCGFNSVAEGLEDLIYEGFSAEELKEGSSSGAVIYMKELKNSDNVLDQMIYVNLIKNDVESGYIYYVIDEDYSSYGVRVFQWSESEDEGIVGQYPDPETDYNKEHTIGEIFESE